VGIELRNDAFALPKQNSLKLRLLSSRSKEDVGTVTTDTPVASVMLVLGMTIEPFQ
jgi:hypothetical protein